VRARTGGRRHRGLIALRPDTAPRLDDTGTAQEVSLDEIVPGDRLLLRPGARVAVDGIVVDGDSHVDEAMLTGEPIPVAKAAGDAVTAGTVNGSGSLTYRARRSAPTRSCPGSSRWWRTRNPRACRCNR
jgi:Cu+-exporting ATPase